MPKKFMWTGKKKMPMVKKMGRVVRLSVPLKNGTRVDIFPADLALGFVAGETIDIPNDQRSVASFENHAEFSEQI